MFDKDFYPTPKEVVQQMIAGVDFRGKVVLEPSAGKGNIVDVVKKYGAREVLVYEKNRDLKQIVESKGTFLGYDFLESNKEELSHIDCIVMNPPFSRDEKHILHAWDVAPEGCQIIALCNSETVGNQYTSHRKRLSRIISDYGDATTDLGDCFSRSERKTGVNVSLVKLFKPVTSSGFDYEGFYMDVEEEGHVDGLMRYSEIRSVVSRYVNALKCFDEFKEISDRMNGLVSPIGLTDGFEFKFGYNKSVTTKEDFAKELQKKSWDWIFGKMNMAKFVTSGVMSDINKFVETQQKYPFTMKNIYRMLEIIIGTRGQIMDRALVEAFDKITQHYHENRYHLEGWKTNSHYLINEKFILPNVCEVGFSGDLKFKFSSWGNEERINDLHKALCYIAGTHPVDPERLDKDNKPEKITGLRSWATGKDLDFATWYDWGFFKIKGFKKGTLHCKFKDKKVWEQFNQRVAEIKGYPLPENVGLV